MYKRDFFSETFSGNEISLAVVEVEESIESCNCSRLQPISMKIDYQVNYMIKARGLAVGSPQFKSVKIPIKINLNHLENPHVLLNISY